MLIIACPYCGSRPESEFRYAGEAHRVRPLEPQAVDDDLWAAYLYSRRNPRGRHQERWRHISCGRFFNAVRDTLSDRIEATYRIGEQPPSVGGSAGS